MKVKSFLIGSKAIPAITYGAHISRIPKQAIRKMRNVIVKALWNGRPMARSKWLVQLFHGQPHRTDPLLAQAFCCILDVVRFCHQNPQAIDRLQAMWYARDTHRSIHSFTVSPLPVKFWASHSHHNLLFGFGTLIPCPSELQHHMMCHRP